jgi:hypothetical protein
MISKTVTTRGGTRVLSHRAVSGTIVDTVVTTQTNIIDSTTVLTVSNGTGGVPGRRLPNAYSFFKDRTQYGSGYEGTFSKVIVNETSGNVNGTSMNPSIYANEPNSMANEVYNRALDSLGVQWRGDLDLTIDGLQSSQTIKMLRQVTKLSNFIRRFSPKRWSENWLEYKYGWYPTVSSIYGLAKEAITPPKDGPCFYVARAGASGVKYSSSVSSGIVDEAFCNRSDRVEIKVCLNLKPTILAQLSRISSLNPASIAWELLPYSFVVDWVFDIGGYLRASENALLGGLVFNHGYVTRGYTIDKKYFRSGSKNLGPDTSYSVNGNRQSYSRYKSRSVLSGYPRPLRPTFQISMGSSRVMSAAALLNQHFKKK